MARVTTKNIRLIIRSEKFHHFLFWIFSYYVLYQLFRYSDQTTRTDLIYTFLFHLSLIPVFYLNVIWLIPQYLSKGKYRFYFLGVIGLLVLGTAMNYGTFRYWTNWLFPGYYFISYFTYFEILQFIGAYWAVSTLLTLSRSWYQLREKEKRIQQLEQQRTAAELRALKAQLDPHFLFNSLNGIYSLALYKDPKTPDALLKLSNTMRYLLYECQASELVLVREWKQVIDFLTLYQMRSQVELKLTIADDLNPEIYTIPPLIILPLVENACKHSGPAPDGKHMIQVNLQKKYGAFLVECANTFRDIPEQPDKQTDGGLGINNYRQRLELLFPQQYTLQYNANDHWFTIQVTIPIKTK